jgi:iron complex outermembrane recepter protein
MKKSVLPLKGTRLGCMKKIVILTVCLALARFASAQTKSGQTLADSTAPKSLQEVLVKAYEQNRKLIEVPAAIGLLTPVQLERFSNSSILPAMNTIPGVRMEERSPGSYRLNIRGSSLRSPFGVRDVKIYYNEIPLTDPSGNTYLNGLGFYNFQDLEVIKGPAGSLYGAAIGGGLLIRTLPTDWHPGVELDYSLGSYATNNLNANVRWGDSTRQNYVDYNHLSSNGYRVQTQTRRDVASWETVVKASAKQTLHAYMYYSDLYYQTPGGLTLAQFNQDPKQARPASGTSPSAVEAQAAVFQQTFVTGISNEYQMSDHWKNTTAVYGSYTNFVNPGIRVYEIRKEPNFGGRTVFQFNQKMQQTKLQVNFGAEAQYGFFNTSDFTNNLGKPGAMQDNEYINNWQYMIFGQADLTFPHGWILTAGLSSNESSISYANLAVPNPQAQSRVFNNKIAPRVALLKRVTEDISVYASAARGFSPPTVSELLTSSGVIGYNLQPEDGIDYEVGARANLLKGRLYVDVNAFFFHIQNAIVQRIDTSGVYYYVNAGSTKQNGLESHVSYQLIDRPSRFINNLKLWASDTWDVFNYQSFIDVNSPSTVLNDYSGKQLPGVPPQVLVIGLDIASSCGLYANVTYSYTAKLPLNDANTAYAGSYNLLGGRIGFRTVVKHRLKMELFTGVDNIFNLTYSLGDDFNAAAGRYYNAAPGINYYAGITLNELFR